MENIETGNGHFLLTWHLEGSLEIGTGFWGYLLAVKEQGKNEIWRNHPQWVQKSGQNAAKIRRQQKNLQASVGKYVRKLCLIIIHNNVDASKDYVWF